MKIQPRHTSGELSSDGVTDRAETALNATLAWRTAVKEEIEKRPRGTQERMAEAVGCSKGLISQLISGQVDHSDFVGPISDFLGIPRPRQVAMEEGFAEVSEMFPLLSPEQQKTFRALMRQMLGRETDGEP